MVYKELYKDFLSAFAEDRKTIQQIAIDNDVDREDGMHIAFGLVVLPYLAKLIEGNKSAQIEKVFSFFEEMATSDDHLISEVLEFTVIEGIIAAGNDFASKCIPYMKPNTYQSYEIVKQNFA